MKKSVFLFDWDGTLIHSLEWKIRNGGRLFAQTFGVSAEQVEAAYRKHSGVPRRELFAAICREVGLLPLAEEMFAHLSGEFSKMNRQVLLDPATPDLMPEDTFPALEALLKAGCHLYVSSSADGQEVADIARALGLEKFFSDSGGEIMGSRPGFGKGPEHVSHACRRHAIQPSEIVFVGDDLSDVALGKAAGAVTVAKIGTHTRESLAASKPDFILQKLTELTRIFA